MEKETFYEAYGEYADKLETGFKLKIEHHVEYESYRIGRPEIAEQVKFSPAELKQKRKASDELEKEIYNKIRGIVKEWEKQAAQTLLLDKALEYVNTPDVPHTSNEWKQRKDGSWEISNLVYKMCYHIWEDTAENKKGTWLVSWALGINVPARPKTEKFYFAGDKIIAEQNKKRYDTFDAAQKYIQGRFDLYVGLFRELRPPVPDEFKRHFYINGCLLPEYTVAPPEITEPDEKAVESLLDFLDEDDATSPPQEAPADPAPPSPAKPQKPTVPPPAGRPKRPPVKPKTKPKRKSSMSR